MKRVEKGTKEKEVGEKTKEKEKGKEHKNDLMKFDEGDIDVTLPVTPEGNVGETEEAEGKFLAH